MPPMTVVMPYTTVHPSSAPVFTVEGSVRSGPPPPAAANEYIMIQINVIAEIMFMTKTTNRMPLRQRVRCQRSSLSEEACLHYSVDKGLQYALGFHV